MSGNILEPNMTFYVILQMSIDLEAKLYSRSGFKFTLSLYDENENDLLIEDYCIANPNKFFLSELQRFSFCNQSSKGFSSIKVGSATSKSNEKWFLFTPNLKLTILKNYFVYSKEFINKILTDFSGFKFTFSAESLYENINNNIIAQQQIEREDRNYFSGIKMKNVVLKLDSSKSDFTMKPGIYLPSTEIIADHHSSKFIIKYLTTSGFYFDEFLPFSYISIKSSKSSKNLQTNQVSFAISDISKVINLKVQSPGYYQNSIDSVTGDSTLKLQQAAFIGLVWHFRFLTDLDFDKLKIISNNKPSYLQLSIKMKLYYRYNFGKSLKFYLNFNREDSEATSHKNYSFMSSIFNPNFEIPELLGNNSRNEFSNVVLARFPLENDAQFAEIIESYRGGSVTISCGKDKIWKCGVEFLEMRLDLIV